MRKLNKRVREGQFNGCSMARYEAKCDLGQLEQSVCMPGCRDYGSDGYTMAMIRQGAYERGVNGNHS